MNYDGALTRVVADAYLMLKPNGYKPQQVADLYTEFSNRYFDEHMDDPNQLLRFYKSLDESFMDYCNEII